MAAYYIDALDSGTYWNDLNITYTYDSIHGNQRNGDATDYELFNTSQRAAADAAFQEIMNVTNLTFTNTESPFSNTDIVLRQADLPENVAGWAYYPNNFRGSDVTIDNTLSTPAQGDFAYYVILHEILHAVGLKHPFSGTDNLPADEDSANATVMSYDSSNNSSIGGATATRDYPYSPHTPQIYDIAALQHIYGVNTNHNSGDTIYNLTSGKYSGIYVGTTWDGAGNDTYDASASTSNNTLDIREGLANVTRVDDVHIWTAFGANIENATGGSGDDVINGNDMNNLLIGNNGNDSIEGNAGNDTLSGGAGNNTLNGGNGDDVIDAAGGDIVDAGAGNDFVLSRIGGVVLDGGAGLDKLSYHASQNGVSVNLKTSATSGGDAQGDTITGFENILGSSYNDTLTGDDGYNYIEGRDGDDILDGGRGGDHLVGSAGDDTLWGGNARDLLDGGDGNDYLLGQQGNDRILGGNGNDLIDAGGNDQVDAGAGNDRVLSRAGADTIDGGDNEDVLMYHTSTAGVNVNIGNNTASGGDATGDVISNFENLRGSNFGDTLTGSGDNNYIVGRGGDDNIDGANGNDTLVGAAGTDTINGGYGADILIGGTDADTFVFSNLIDSTDSAQDIIHQFTHGEDIIDLSSLGFTGVQSGTGTGNILGLTDNGSHTFLNDINSSFAIQLTGVVALDNTDFIFA